MNRQGDFEAAVAELHGVARRIKGYAGTDPELNAIADALLAEEAQWSVPALVPVTRQ